MVNGWKIATLGKILNRVKQEIPIEDDVTYRQVTVRLWNKGVILRGEQQGSEIKTKRQFVIQSGQLILSRIDVRNGAIGLCPPELDGAIISNDFWAYDFDHNLVYPEFLSHYVRTPGFIDDANRTSSGTTKRIRSEEGAFLRIEIPLPPLTEQRRIVSRIEALAGRVAEAQSLRRVASEATKVLLYSVLNSVFSTSLQKRKSINELCKTTSGGTPSRSRPDFFEGNIPWIKSGELEDGFIHRAEELITEDAVATSNAKIFPKGTLVVALYGATVGKTGVLEIDAATNQAVCAVFPQKEIVRDYLWWFLRSKRPDFLKSSFGGAQPNISQKVIRETELPVPPLEEQRRLVAYLDGLQAQVSQLRHYQEETQKELDALMPSILDKAFKGEL